MTPAFRYGFAVKCAQLGLNQPQAEYLFAKLAASGHGTLNDTPNQGEPGGVGDMAPQFIPSDEEVGPQLPGPGKLEQLQAYLTANPQAVSALLGGGGGAALGAGAGALAAGKGKRGMGAGLGALAGGGIGALAGGHMPSLAGTSAGQALLGNFGG
jgi:hypothetical protein